MKNYSLKELLFVSGVTVIVSAVVSVLYPISWLLNLPRNLKIRHKQKIALTGLNMEQQKLLFRLWNEEQHCRQLQEAYSGGHFDVGQRADAAVQKADESIQACRDHMVDEWRIDAFRITTYD